MTLPDTQLNSTELLSSMTPEQKLGQLFLINLNGIEADQDFIKLEETYHFGNVYLSGQNLRSPEQVQQLNRQLLHLILPVVLPPFWPSTKKAAVHRSFLFTLREPQEISRWARRIIPK